MKSDIFLSLTPGNFNTKRLRHNDLHFPDNIFKHIYLNENVGISIQISLKFNPSGAINNNPALVHGMAVDRRQATIRANDSLAYWGIYASLGLTELIAWWHILASVKFVIIGSDEFLKFVGYHAIT